MPSPCLLLSLALPLLLMADAAYASSRDAAAGSSLYLGGGGALPSKGHNVRGALLHGRFELLLEHIETAQLRFQLGEQRQHRPELCAMHADQPAWRDRAHGECARHGGMLEDGILPEHVSRLRALLALVGQRGHLRFRVGGQHSSVEASHARLREATQEGLRAKGRARV